MLNRASVLKIKGSMLDCDGQPLVMASRDKGASYIQRAGLFPSSLI